MFIENSNGPRIEPWGTPLLKCLTEEQTFAMKQKVLLEEYEHGRYRAVPLKPNLEDQPRFLDGAGEWSDQLC